MSIFGKKEKPILIEMEIFTVPDSDIPEYQGYELPKELDQFLERITDYSEKGWKIKVYKTSYEEMLVNLMHGA